MVDPDGTDAAVGSPSGDGRLLDSYRKLLSALVGDAGGAGVRRSPWPDMLLPAPRDELAATLGRAQAAETNSVERERLEAMASLLGRFSEDPNAVGAFVASVVATPTVLSVAYAIWLAFRGESWWWLLGAAGVFVGGLWGLALRFRLADGSGGVPARFAGGFLLGLLKLCVLVGSASLWFRLVFGGVLYGLYRGIVVEFSVWAIALAIVAGVVGYYYSKALNTLYQFLWWVPLARSRQGA